MLEALAANLAAEQRELARQDWVLFRELLSPVQVPLPPHSIYVGARLDFLLTKSKFLWFDVLNENILDTMNHKSNAIPARPAHVHVTVL